ncbi:MAG: ATP-binding protein [Chloroflexota bacterium]
MMRSIRLKLTLALFLSGISGTLLTLLVISDRVIGPLSTTEIIPRTVLQEDLGDAFQLAFVGSVVVALLIGAWWGRAISRPLQQLTAASRQLAEGALGTQVDIQSRDEVGALAHTFNQMSADLATAQKQREQMTADIAHDLRTPLSVIAGYTEALDEGKLSSSPEIHRTIRQQVNHLQHLVEQLRLLSLADSGALSLSLSPIEPIALLEQVALAFMPAALDKEIALTIDAPDTRPWLYVDVARMTQVLHNLMSNALQHTPTGGQITLAARTTHEHIELTVSNSGPSIAKEDLLHIFDRFYRTDKSRSSSTGQTGNSGLGLAIAKALVEAHEGKITVDSAAERTTFTVMFAAHELS